MKAYEYARNLQAVTALIDDLNRRSDSSFLLLEFDFIRDMYTITGRKMLCQALLLSNLTQIFEDRVKETRYFGEQKDVLLY